MELLDQETSFFNPWNGFFIIIGVILFVTVLSCSSAPKTFGQEDFDENNTAPGAAYRVDALTVRTPMKSHSDWKPWEFYFKHCSEIGEEIYYSKTSYECSGPY